jgi:hypothetical protein
MKYPTVETRMPRSIVLLAIGCAFAITGCSRGPAMTKVAGVVTIDGRPLQKGSITFEPIDGRGITVGATIEGGSYVTEAMPGEKKVRITGFEVVGQVPAYKNVPNSRMNDVVKDIVPSRYNNNTELTLEVEESETTGNFELESS